MIDNKIKPFGPMLSCPKCGTGEEQAQPVFMPPSDADQFSVLGPSLLPVPGPGYSPMRVRFCPGGQEPETPGELDPMSATLQTVMASINSISAKQIEIPALRGKLNICAGIGEEHLHATCQNCGYEFLMATKDSEVETHLPPVHNRMPART